MKYKREKLVTEDTAGTGYLGCCLNCSQPIGKKHLKGCEFTTGEDDSRRHGGMLGATAREVREANERTS